MRRNNPEVSGILLGLCSFFIPGLGQALRGNSNSAIWWLIGTVLGYCLFFLPGLYLHLRCIADAVDSR